MAATAPVDTITSDLVVGTRCSGGALLMVAPTAIRDSPMAQKLSTQVPGR